MAMELNNSKVLTYRL